MVPLVAESDLPSRTLAWLLEPSNPSARYLTLTQVVGQHEDAPEVCASRAAIPNTGPVRDILLAQYPQGYWMHPGIGYSPRYRATLWQILVLAQLGMFRCEALDRAVEHLFATNQREDGAFRASKEPYDTPVDLNGSLLWALETLGYGDLCQVGAAWSWLANEVDAHGFGATSSQGETPSWGAVKALWAANAVPPRRRGAAVERVGRAAATSLLDAPPDRAGSDPRWFRLAFPLMQDADLLQWMAVLVEAGYGHHPRLAAARSWLGRKRRPDGTWPLERIPGKLWADIGQLGEPSKWITIRALAVDRRPAAGAP